MNIFKCFLILLLTGMIGGTSLLLAEEWPHFLGPQKNNVSSETGINKDWNKKTPKKLWEISLGDNGYAGPCVADGKVFIIDRKDEKEIVRAINFKTGKNIWTHSYKDAAKPKWGYGRTTPLYENGLLYTLGRMGMLICFDAASGKVKWSMNIVSKFNGKAPTWHIAISPVIDGDKLIVCPGGSKGVVALNKLSGKLIWQGGNSDKTGYATPVISTFNGKKQYIIFTGVNLIGVDPSNGKVLWSYEWITKHDVNASAPIVIDDKHIFISSGYKHGAALLKVDGKKVKQVWVNEDFQLHFSTAILLKGYLYGTSNKNGFQCINAKTGKVKWEQEKYGKAGPLLVDGVFLVVDDKSGDLMMAAASTSFKEIGRISPLGKGSWTSPVLSDKKLLIRDLEKMVCLDLN